MDSRPSILNSWARQTRQSRLQLALLLLLAPLLLDCCRPLLLLVLVQLLLLLLLPCLLLPTIAAAAEAPSWLPEPCASGAAAAGLLPLPEPLYWLLPMALAPKRGPELKPEGAASSSSNVGSSKACTCHGPRSPQQQLRTLQKLSAAPSGQKRTTTSTSSSSSSSAAAGWQQHVLLLQQHVLLLRQLPLLLGALLPPLLDGIPSTPTTAAAVRCCLPPSTPYGSCIVDPRDIIAALMLLLLLSDLGTADSPPRNPGPPNSCH